MFKTAENRWSVLSRNIFSKNLTKILEIKNIMSEMKNTLDGINMRLDTIEEKINELEDTSTKNIQSETQREKKRMNKNQEQSISGQRNNFKQFNIHTIGIP